MSRRAGFYQFAVNGTVYDVVGEANYNIGSPMREALVGHDSVHGYSEKPQVPFVELEVRDGSALDLRAFTNLVNVNVQVQLANGKLFVLRNAWYAGEGTVGTESANIATRFEGLSADEVAA